MYCKKCGKVIPDDSLFCQYCGELLSDSKPTNKQERKGLISRFQSLSKGWQICFMSYVCWVFLWIILCVTEAIYEDDQAIYLLLFVIVIPVLALFVWYYFARLRNKSQKENVKNVETTNEIAHLSDAQMYSEYSIYPLLSFAKMYGKMQVKVERGDEGQSSSYCVFTNTNGEVTQVDFGTNTSGMTAIDIANKKESLFVVKGPNSVFTLIYL